MDGRSRQSTVPGPAASAAAALPEPTGPTDDRFVYRLTPQALHILAEHGAGEELAHPAARITDAAEAIEAESKRRRRCEARRRGRRLATISHCTRGSQRLPLLRLSGNWLREAGFDLGQEYEVEVGEGRLTLEAM